MWCGRVSLPIMFVTANLWGGTACVDDGFETEYFESEGKPAKGEAGTENGAEKSGGDREAVALTRDRRLGFLRNPIEGSDEYTFELISDHSFDNPDDPIDSLQHNYYSVASHPTDLDVVYVQTAKNKFWLKIFEVNLETLEVTEIFSRENTGYRWGSGMGTDCAGNLYLTHIVEATHEDIGRVVRLDLTESPLEYEEVNNWDYGEQLPPISNQPAYTDLVGDFDGSLWGFGEEFAQILGEDATVPVTPWWTPETQAEEIYVLGVALSREYLAEGEVQEFLIANDDFTNFDIEIMTVRPGESVPVTLVGRHVHGQDPGAKLVDLATLPGWCLCGGPEKEALDDANEDLNDLLYTMFYLDWDIRNAQASTSPFAILIEAGVLAFSDSYDCVNEATIGGLEDCYADLEAQRDALLETINELEEILAERGCELGDL